MYLALTYFCITSQVYITLVNFCTTSPVYLTVYPKKYAHGYCFAVLCCGYTLTDFPISIRLTSLALWQSNDCPSASKATLMNMDKYFMWIHYERLHNHNKAKHNKTVCIFLGIYCTTQPSDRCRILKECINSSPPSAAYMRQWIGSALVSDNGLSPIRRQVIIETNAGLLTTGRLRTNFTEIFVKI